MKKILPFVAIVVFATSMVACNRAPQTAGQSTTATPQVDTTGMAAFQAWKQQRDLAAVSEYYNQDQNNANSYSPQSGTSRTYSSPARTTSRSSSGTRSRSTSSRGSSVYRGSGSGSSSGTTASTRRGWSKAAKGAVVGGVVGAGAGAIINKKNRAAGAVIGGILGAGAGYGIGRGMDKRDGRY